MHYVRETDTSSHLAQMKIAAINPQDLKTCKNTIPENISSAMIVSAKISISQPVRHNISILIYCRIRSGRDGQVVADIRCYLDLARPGLVRLHIASTHHHRRGHRRECNKLLYVIHHSRSSVVIQFGRVLSHNTGTRSSEPARDASRRDRLQVPGACLLQDAPRRRE